jgi:hypothetical protein
MKSKATERAIKRMQGNKDLVKLHEGRSKTTNLTEL